MSATPPSRERVTEVNAAYHDAIAEKYDQRGEGTSRHVLEWNQAIFDREVLPKIAGLAERPEALDLGCGSGYLEQFLEARGVDVLGFDVSNGMLDRARERYPWATFETGDVYDYDPARKFHLVMEHAVLHHLLDYEAVLDRMAELTLPGGVLFLGNEPNRRAYRYLTPLKKLYRVTINRYRTADTVALLGDPEYEAMSEYHLFYGDGIDARALKRRLIEKHGFRDVRLHFSLRELFASLEEAAPRLKLNSVVPAVVRDHFPLSRNFTLVAHR